MRHTFGEASGQVLCLRDWRDCSPQFCDKFRGFLHTLGRSLPVSSFFRLLYLSWAWVTPFRNCSNKIQLSLRPSSNYSALLSDCPVSYTKCLHFMGFLQREQHRNSLLLPSYFILICIYAVDSKSSLFPLKTLKIFISIIFKDKLNSSFLVYYLKLQASCCIIKMDSTFGQEHPLSASKSAHKQYHKVAGKIFVPKPKKKQRETHKKQKRDTHIKSARKPQPLRVVSLGQISRIRLTLNGKGGHLSWDQGSQSELAHTSRQQYSEIGYKFREGMKGNKIEVSGLKGAINFDGKFIRNASSSVRTQNPYWSFQAMNGTQQTERHHTQIHDEQKKSIDQRKQKRNKKSTSNNKRVGKTKQKINILASQRSKEQNSNRHILSTKQSSYDQFVKTNKLFNKDQNKLEPNQFDDFKHLLQTEKNKVFKINYINKVNSQVRGECLTMLSKLCWKLNLRKQSFGMAVSLMDSYFNDQIILSKHKILALACLLIAIKIDEPQKMGCYVYYILSFKKISQGKQKICSSSSTKSIIKEKSPTNAISKQKKNAQMMQKSKLNKQKSSQKLRKGNIEQTHLLDEFLLQPISKQDFLEFERMILLKDEYKIFKTTHNYWIDSLTFIWDKFIIDQKIDFSGSQKQLLFRQKQNLKNYSYLVQIIERSRYSTTFYGFSLPLIVLATMYLLVRARLQGEEGELLIFKQKLQKSSNFLFGDRTGVNKVYGEYLNQIGIDMSEVLPCCQFIGPSLFPQFLRDFKYLDCEDSLSYHFHNQRLTFTDFYN